MAAGSEGIKGCKHGIADHADADADADAAADVFSSLRRGRRKAGGTDAVLVRDEW